MGRRRILRVKGQAYSLAAEAPFESEAELHRAVAEHPEVLPADELGLGPLVSVGVELDLGAGPMDLLAVDGGGRVLVIEFKRGSQNPDVRKVVAQLLDYGSALWRTTYDALDEACGRGSRGRDGDPIIDHVAAQFERLGEPFDAEAFRTGLEATLASGDFVFLYVARDVDVRTRRIMTYLGEGPRLSIFAVEVAKYSFGQGDAVLVPRVAFVPSWVAEHGVGRAHPARGSVTELFEAAEEDVHQVDERLARMARNAGWVVQDSDRARNYRPVPGEMAIALYPHWRVVHLWLKGLRDRGQEKTADRLREEINALFPQRQAARHEASVPVETLVSTWQRAEERLLRPYMDALSRQKKDDAEGPA